MNVLAVTAENFRNLSHQTIEFSPNVNVIYGKNAQGKTNLLEALWLFTGGHSFRGVKDPELICFGEATCKLSLQFFSEGREQTIDLTIMGKKRQFFVNGVEKRTGADLIGKFCSVIFSPEHLGLVKNGPALRRSFLDTVLCQSRPSYAKDFVRYQRTLQQRNTLLKEVSKQPSLQSTLEIWDQALAERGVALIRQRREMTQFLESRSKEIYSGLSQNTEVLTMSYSTIVPDEEPITESVFLEKLERCQGNDLLLGHTSVGPHRDDLDISINGISARLYGSQGQQRSVVLSLKLAEAAVLEELTGEKPVILLDDVMSELDTDRQDYLLHRIQDQQIFLTCCNPEVVRILQNGNVYFVTDGTVTQESKIAK